MEAYKTEPSTLSAFIHFCTNCEERRRVNGEWVSTNRRRGFFTGNGRDYKRYEILNILLDAHELIFHLQTKDGLVYKSFSIYECGWAYDTYGMMTFIHRDGNGKMEKWNISWNKE